MFVPYSLKKSEGPWQDIEEELKRFIYKSIGIPAEQLASMHTTDRARILGLKKPSQESYYKFISPEEYEKRERKLDKFLEK